MRVRDCVVEVVMNGVYVEFLVKCSVLMIGNKENFLEFEPTPLAP